MCGTGHGLKFTEKRAKVFGMGWSLYTCSGFGVCVCRTEISDMKILSSMEPILHVCDMDIQQHSYNDGVKQSLGVSSFSIISPPPPPPFLRISITIKRIILLWQKEGTKCLILNH